ncbi:hypothetical protein [Pikeienuella sp. HZG-20]|uniref:helix-turn-helix transcriptional regulator n=1 Tax=Paludibacillus litoralis TaxID=3133267 RepID=UPI0030EEE0FC
MLKDPLTRGDLAAFFNTKNTHRALTCVLRGLGIRLNGGTTRWSVVLASLGLAEDQDPARQAELTEPLLTAAGAAALIGVSSSVIYRWEKGRLAEGAQPFPKSIDLSGGRENARAKRWRKAEIIAWHRGQRLPVYARAAPVFGSIRPPK